MGWPAAPNNVAAMAMRWSPCDDIRPRFTSPGDGHAVLCFIELDLDAHLGPFLLNGDTSVRFLVGQAA